MKTIQKLDTGWFLKQLEPVDTLDISWVNSLFKDDISIGLEFFPVFLMPAQVYEILIVQGIIENPNIKGNSISCQWVAEKDWIYINKFPSSTPSEIAYINFKGLDTYADVYLNGEKIHEHDDVYLPAKVDVTGKLLFQNILAIHFHSPRRKIADIVLPGYLDNAEKKIHDFARTRMFGSTFSDYLGPKPCLFRVGVYDDIEVVYPDQGDIVRFHAPYTLSRELDFLSLTVELEITGNISGMLVDFVLVAPDGSSITPISV
ncbi:MAG: hypothetical protein LBE13_02245, partial [Bacteroidales bacterium]|nr:hypothetical protein [Bacteroidales bacterium]